MDPIMIEPKTRKLLTKMKSDDAFVDDYKSFLSSIDERMCEIEAELGPLALTNREWHRYRRMYKAINKILRYHIRKYSLKF